MSSSKKKLLSLIASVITEICDDSDDEDLLPFEALSEINNEIEKLKHNVEKEQQEQETKSPKRKNAKIVEDNLKYVRPSRFEDTNLIYFTNAVIKFTDYDTNCKRTLKLKSACMCIFHFYENYSPVEGFCFYGK